MLLKKLFLFSTFFSIAFLSFGQCPNVPEICNNGIDDDCDGFVDCFDGDCAGSLVCANSFTSGIVPECPDTPDVALFSMREQFRTAANVGYGYATPVVGDMDSDGIPEIVTVSNASKRIYVANGQTGALITSIAYQQTYHNFAGGVSIADIDNDGTGEVFIVTGNAAAGFDNNNSRQYISCYDYDGGALTFRYRMSFGQNNRSEYDGQKYAVPQFVDFDKDGTTEIFIGNHVMNASTGAIIASPTVAQRYTWPRGRYGAAVGMDDYMSAAYDILPDGFCATCDGVEIIAGNTVYAVDLSDPTNTQNGITVAAQMTPTGTYRDGLTSIADWDGDGEMDVIVVAGNGTGAYVYVWNPRTQTIIQGATDIQAGNSRAGRASVADFDGDGTNELAIVSQNRLHVFEPNLSIKWSAVVIDESANTSATAFDFEGDGNMEVVYRDEQNLYILDGTDGSPKVSLPCRSGTRVEMPVIADVDADGEAEIICSCDNYGGGSRTVVFTSDQTPWMPTRKVWNSLHYAPTFINDDLTIPAARQHKSLFPNLDIYAAQAHITDPNGNVVYPALPDFVVSFDSSTVSGCDDDSTAVFITICNDDSKALKYNYPVSFYDGNPSSGGTFLGTRTITNSNTTFIRDSCYQFTFNAANQPTDLYVIANDDGTGNFGYPTTSLLECDSSNNVANGEIGCPIDGAITKTDGRENYIPGTTLTYEIVAYNYGPDFTGGIVSDPLPAGISASDVTWTAVTHGGASTTAAGIMNGALQDTVDIPGGDSIVYTVNITTPSNLTGDLVNTVTIDVPGDTITDNSVAIDTDTIDCTFAISGVVNSRTAAWQQLGTVVSGFTYNFNSSAATKNFTATNGPENGNSVYTVIYNTTTNNHVSLGRHRYNPANNWWNTITTYDNSPWGWTGLSGTAPENAPILGFMAFIDQNGNGTFDSGIEEYIRDLNTLSITPTTSGELYMAFYDDGNYTDNNGIITIDASIAAPNVDLGIDSTICSGDSILLDAGNPSALNWVWNTGETTQTIQGKSAGEYSVIVTTLGGCTTLDTTNIIVDTVIVSLGNDTSLCTDSAYVLDAGNPSADTWVWNDGNTSQLDTVNTASTYSVIVTNPSGCEGYDTVVVSIIPQLNLGLGNDTSICVGETINFTFTKPTGATQLWNTGSTTQSITVDSAASYSVIVIDSNGCPNHDTIVLSLDSLPVVVLGNDTTICQDSTVTITSPVGTNWSWSTGGNTQSISTSTAGVYDVTVTDANGCVNYDTLEVSIASGSNINLGNDTSVCVGDSLFLDAGNGTSWTWSNLQNTQTISVTSTNTYIVDVTYASGCVFSDTIDLVFNPLPVVNLGNDTTICEYSNFSLDAQTGTDWLWNTGAITQSISTSTAQDYSVIVTDINDCVNYDTLTLSLINSPKVSLGNDTTICDQSTITYTVGNGTSWLWNDGTSGSSLTTTGPDTISVIASNGVCSTYDTVIVASSPLPVVNLGNDTTICEGTSIVLDAENSGSSYVWQDNSTNQSLVISTQATYYVDVTNPSDCFGTDTIDITVSPSLSAPVIDPKLVAICDLVADSVELNVLNDEGMTIGWNTDDSTIMIVADSAGMYIVTKTNVFECSASDTAQVVRECDTIKITIPNVFTPNNDGTNDDLIPLENPVDLVEHIAEIEFIVYNRWGRAMFASVDVLPMWNGRFMENNMECPAGVYFWVINYTNVQGQSFKINGFVQLMR